jgi:predicted small lipoprotein YifL
MKKLIAVLALVTLAGCSSLGPWPSKWDVNQAKVTTDLRQTTHNFDCKGNLTEQLTILNLQIQWFDLYAESKSTKDVAHLTDTMKGTAKEFAERANKGPVSPLYCDLKKKLMIQQADIIAKTVQGRF